MKAVLTCDDVFEVLTRAPFPSGTSDDQIVESHLAVCHDCRQLAEALRPAVGLFHEALNADVDEELPAYRGELSSIRRCSDWNEPSVAPHILAASATAASKTTKQRALTQSWIGMATCLTVVLVATFAIAVSRSQLVGDEAAIESPALSMEDRDATLLAALDLPVDCTTSVKSNLAASSFDCCTKCHTAGSDVSSSNTVVLKSSAACVACHDWLAERVSQSLSFIFTPQTTNRNKQPVVAWAAFIRPAQRLPETALNPTNADHAPRRHADREVTFVARQIKRAADRRESVSTTVAQLVDLPDRTTGNGTSAYPVAQQPHQIVRYIAVAAIRNGLSANVVTRRQLTAATQSRTVKFLVA